MKPMFMICLLWGLTWSAYSGAAMGGCTDHQKVKSDFLPSCTLEIGLKYPATQVSRLDITNFCKCVSDHTKIEKYANEKCVFMQGAFTGLVKDPKVKKMCAFKISGGTKN